MMGPNLTPAAGAADVTAAMAVFFDAFTMDVEYTSAEMVVSGDVAYDRGTYSQTLTPTGAGDPITENGNYLWVYRRSPDGSWKQSRIIWNSSDPLAVDGAQHGVGARGSCGRHIQEDKRV